MPCSRVLLFRLGFASGPFFEPAHLLLHNAEPREIRICGGMWAIVLGLAVAQGLAYYLLQKWLYGEPQPGVDVVQSGDAIHFTSKDGDWRTNCVAITG